MERLSGLSTTEYNKLLNEFGANKLPEPKTTPAISLFIDQFKNLFSVLLILAVVLSFLAGDKIDGTLILFILILNSSLSFWQEYKATREIKLLRNYEPPKSRVIRNNVESEVLSESLVPGDIVILEAGDKIPADGVLLHGYEFAVNESALTGEAVPVSKSASEKNNEIYLGTWVTGGKGRMRVTLTGQNTKFGKIALNLETLKEEATPLEISLNRLAVKISLLIITIAFILALLTFLQGVALLDVIISSIALIIAAVPEGLPAIITVLLAIGGRRMYRKKTLIRKMSSIENLGTTDVICIDKTGTITKNEMKVRKIDLENKSSLPSFIKTAVLCNTATIAIKEKDNTPDILGDSMEGALIIWAGEQGANIDTLRMDYKVVNEIPFDSKRKMMSVITQSPDELTLFSKGAPEVIIALCKLSAEEKFRLDKKYKDMAALGLRVLAFSIKTNLANKKIEGQENDMQFLGLVGVADEPRPEAKEAIAKARRAGIEIVMITGDNELTAKSISEEVGIILKGDEIITGQQLDNLSDKELKSRLNKIRIYARTNPEHKLRIVTAFQEIGKVVAVTGDGVNDSLAIKKAHVGISMGESGTDVAKEASDIVILDDNLSTIITAIEQGRLVYNNIVKVVRFLLTGNLSEVLLIVIATLLGFPIPLLPVQILWVNFVTDGLPAISLAAEKANAREMLTPPRGKDNSLFDLKTLRFITFFGVLIALISVSAFIFGVSNKGLEYGRSLAFTVMIVSQMAFVLFVIRRGSPITSNKYLLFSVLLVLFIQFLILTFAPLRHIFGI